MATLDGWCHLNGSEKPQTCSYQWKLIIPPACNCLSVQNRFAVKRTAAKTPVTMGVAAVCMSSVILSAWFQLWQASADR